jgi:hypothetical protein
MSEQNGKVADAVIEARFSLPASVENNWCNGFSPTGCQGEGTFVEGRVSQKPEFLRLIDEFLR